MSIVPPPDPTATLSEPISKLFRPTRYLLPGSSLSKASAALRKNGTPFIPVADEAIPIGIITEAGLLAALARGDDPEGPVESVMEEALILPASTTGADAMRQLTDQDGLVEGAIVVEGAGKILGLLLPSDLFTKPPVRLRPPSPGGMATPFGVYLVGGNVSAGPPWWALVASGVTLVTMLTICRLGVILATSPLGGPHGIPHPVLFVIQDVATFAVFAITFRWAPLAGIHAAEHMVVHAIERDEMLTPEVVARMPRVHPRCGTNLAAGAILLTLTTMDWGIDRDYLSYQLIVGIIITSLFWRRLGSLIQYWVTTRPPTSKELAMGIRSGEELLAKYAKDPLAQPNFLRRIWNSGIVYVALGGMLTGWFFALLFYAFNRLDWIGL